MGVQLYSNIQAKFKELNMIYDCMFTSQWRQFN